MKFSDRWILFGSLGLLLAAAGLGGCDGGTSSETVGVKEEKVEATAGPNAITGRTDSGNSLELYSVDFLPQANLGFAKAVTADSTGAFTFAELPPGRYQLLARHRANGKAALLTELTVPAEANASDSAPLEPTGTLSGTIPESTPGYPAFAYAPGTPFFAQADSLNHFELKGMPAGEYTVVKTWSTTTCAPSATCGGETRRDSALVQIRSGESSTW
ncbi:MAG: carboxypeptidase regulatory-like domain-containing protein [Fibrobacteres bacterium]|nr:carboxypeptidase regulatory-like domain-containing protein [Fibrobacterota bacterium]